MVGWGAFFDETFSLDEFHVRRVLVCGRDPTVADEQTLERPLATSIRGDGLVTLLDGLCDVRNMLAGIGFTCKVELRIVSERSSEGGKGTNVIAFIFGEQLKELLHEDDELSSHLIQLMEIAIGIHVTKASTDGIIDEQEIRELIPPARVVFQRVVILKTVGSNFHQRAVHRAASWATIQPDYGPLSVRDMAVLEVPEEQIAVRFGVDFDVTGAC